jgi:hypothetical protein
MRANREGQAGSHRGREFYRILLWFTATGSKLLILLRFQE